MINTDKEKLELIYNMWALQIEARYMSYNYKVWDLADRAAKLTEDHIGDRVVRLALKNIKM